MDRFQLQQRYNEDDRNFQKLALSGADLSGLDLRDVDFRGADLYGAKLMDSLLHRANFSVQPHHDRTNLAYANLSGADLSGADLCGADLAGASLEGAIVQGALYDAATTFPLGFKPEAAGMIHRQERDRQNRIDQTALLRTQVAGSNTPEPRPAPLPAPLPAPAAPLTSPPAGSPPTLFAPPPPEAASTLSSVLDNTVTSVDISTSVSASHSAPQPSTAKPTQPASSSKLGCTSMIALSGLGFLGGMILAVMTGILGLNPVGLRFNPQNPNPFQSLQYPQAACGDPLPSNPGEFPVNVYPVFIDDSDANLTQVVAQYCQDAFRTNRKDSGALAIQVASFRTSERAQQFAQFMQQVVGSGDTGIPTQIDR